MLDKLGPHVSVDRRIFDWGVGKDQGVGIDKVSRVFRRISYQVVIAITEPSIHFFGTRTVARVARCHIRLSIAGRGSATAAGTDQRQHADQGRGK